MNKGRIKIDRAAKPKSNQDFFTQFEEKLEPKKEEQQVKKEAEYTRQTFMISHDDLEKLKDFVHTKRKYEDYNYSQKQALEEALKLLFNSIEKIEKRSST